MPRATIPCQTASNQCNKTYINETMSNKLRRSADKKISGVCGGIADFLGIDPTLVRVIYLLATIFTAFSGCIVYLILWAVMPDYWK